jgi:hypothetical protein
MFTEYEIETLIQDQEISQSVKDLKKDFLKKEAPFLEISDQDFLSLVFLTPTIAIALANKNISLSEELTLNKKARKLSKGSYFFKKDPVVSGMQFLIKKFDEWEERFLDTIRVSMSRTFDLEEEKRSTGDMKVSNLADYRKLVLNSPYILIRFISAFFLEEDEDIFTVREIPADELDVSKQLAAKLGLENLAVFKGFCDYTFKPK